jgi:hypothetical protein
LYNLINQTINGQDAEIWVKDATCYLASSISIPSNIKLKFLNGGNIKMANGKAITGVSASIEAGSGQQIFDLSLSGSSGVAGTWKVEKLYPHWFGAVGADGDYTDELQCMFNLVNDYLTEVYIPSGSYQYTALSIKPKTNIIGENKKTTTLKFVGTTPDTDAITISAAVSGVEGYVTFENVTHQNISRTVAGISCIVPAVDLSNCKVKNCTFYRWTKFCIDVTDAAIVDISSNEFNACNSVAASVYPAVCIVGTDDNNVINIKDNWCTRCDCFVDIRDTVAMANIIIDNGNVIEYLGYTYDDNLNTIDNTHFDSYTAIVITGARCLSIQDTYLEGLRGIFADLESITAYSIKRNYIEGQEPSSVGGSVTMDICFDLEGCASGEISHNYIANWNYVWLRHDNRTPIKGLETNYLYNNSARKYFPEEVVGKVFLNDVPTAPTLLNSWANYLNNYAEASYYKDSNGIVHLNGVVDGGAAASVIFKLPIQYRPSYIQTFFCGSNTSGCRVNVLPNGDVQHVDGDEDKVSLSNISFRAREDIYTKVLLHFQGANLSTDFWDVLGKTITPSSAPAISTTQSKFGGTSGLFDGTDDAITVTDANNDLDIGTNDFTIEFWVRFNDVTGAQILVDFRQSAPDNISPVIQKTAGHLFSYSVEGGAVITGTTTVLVDTWYHVAVSRYNGITKMFVDGTQEGDDYTDTNNYISVTSIVIAARYTIASFFNGYMDEFRFTNGIAQYIDDFSVQTSAFD